MNYSPSSSKKTPFEIFQKSVFFFSFLNSDFLSSGPVLFHPGPSHSTKWGILSVFFLIPPRRYWFVIFCLEIKKKSCVLMGCKCAVFHSDASCFSGQTVFLRFDLSLVVSSQHEKIVVFQHPSVNSEDFFPLILKSIKFNKAFSKIDIVGLLKNKRIVLLWQKACHPK